jgi:hypothetical protein
MTSHPSISWLGQACVLVFMLACIFTSSLPGSGESTDQTSADQSSDAFDETPTQVDLWIEATTSLRSVTLELVAAFSWREPKMLTAQVDSAGNIHLSHPVSIPEELAATPEAPRPGDFELFIVDARAYTRIGSDAPVTQDDAFLTMLEDALLGAEGPGLWLNILSDDSLTPSGSEPYGGFSTTKYDVYGQVDEGSVSGTIWIDESSAALVRAELTISEGLFYPPGSGLSGDVQISLHVEQADVPVITLP